MLLRMALVGVSWALLARVGPSAPVPVERPVITCELTVTGFIDGNPVPGGGEVAVKNVSQAPVDIPWTSHPLGRLELAVRAENGSAIETSRFAQRFSPQSIMQQHLTLQPGEVYRHPVALLSTVPSDKLVPGVYMVKAAFVLDGKSFDSNVVKVTWPGSEK